MRNTAFHHTTTSPAQIRTHAHSFHLIFLAKKRHATVTITSLWKCIDILSAIPLLPLTASSRIEYKHGWTRRVIAIPKKGSYANVHELRLYNPSCRDVNAPIQLLCPVSNFQRVCTLSVRCASGKSERRTLRIQFTQHSWF